MKKNLTFLDNVQFNMVLGNLKVYITKLNRSYISKEGYIADSNKETYIPMHKHNEYEFHIITKGKGYIKIQDYGLDIKAGELFITGPNVKHMQVSNTVDPMFEYCLRCKMEILKNAPDFPDFASVESNLIVDTLSQPYPYVFKYTNRLDQRFEEIFNEAENQIPGYYAKVQVLILEIMVDIFRTVAPTSIMNFRYEMPQKTHDALASQRLTEFVETMYKFNVTLEEVSKYLAISKKQINQIMKKQFNRTFHEYMLQYRFNVAKELLLTTNMTIEEVAYESGFSSHYYMYQVFKNLGAPTPNTFRSK